MWQALGDKVLTFPDPVVLGEGGLGKKWAQNSMVHSILVGWYLDASAGPSFIPVALYC